MQIQLFSSLILKVLRHMLQATASANLYIRAVYVRNTSTLTMLTVSCWVINRSLLVSCKKTCHSLYFLHDMTFKQ